MCQKHQITAGAWLSCIGLCSAPILRLLARGLLAWASNGPVAWRCGSQRAEGGKRGIGYNRARRRLSSMRFLIGVSSLVILFTIPQKAISQNAAPLHLKVGAMDMQALSIERMVNFPSIVHLKGTVEIATKV